MENLTFDQLVEKYPLCLGCFAGIYAMGLGENQPFDHHMAALMMQTTGVDMQAVEDEMRGLTGAQIAEIILSDPGTDFPYAPLTGQWIDRAFE